MKSYQWKRFWSPREGTMHLDSRGYLYDPERGDGLLLNRDVVSFDQVRATPCLVLLGEPGTGKTRALSDERSIEEGRVADEGASSLWVDLRDVASAAELSAAIFDRSEWLDSSKPCHLFIDSLDECPIGVEAVVRPLMAGLVLRPPGTSRIRLVCRTAEWPDVLETKLSQLWPENKVFEIAPLRRVDVENAAQTHGLDAEEALAAIAEHEAEAFALRPVTLQFLLTILAGGKPLPNSRVDLYKQLCRSLCEEHSESRAKSSISPDGRLALSERIAASLLFGGKTSIYVDADRGDLKEGDLPIRDLVGDREAIEGDQFVDATEAAIRDALSSGLFNSRGPGRLAFAHQSFSEFLAARYVTRRKLTLEQLRGIVVHPGLDRVVPSLHGTAAWLSSMDRAFFDFAVGRDPKMLLSADPSTFDRGRRRNLVEAILARYDKHEQLDREFFRREPFEKLAHDGIDVVLRPFILGKDHAVGARRVACEIARACRVTSLCQDLLSVMKDVKDHLGVRTSAAYAFEKLADDDERLALRPFALESDPTDLRDDLKGSALRALWPKHLTADELVKSLTPARDNSYAGAYQFFVGYDVVKSATPADIFFLLQWTTTQGARTNLAEPMRALVDAAMRTGWGSFEDQPPSDAFVRAARTRIRKDGHPLSEQFSQADPWKDEVGKRRKLLRELLVAMDDTENDRHAYIKLLRDGDFVCLIGMLDDEGLDSAGRTFLVSILRELASSAESFETVDALATAMGRHEAVASALAPLFAAWPVEGEKANEARATQTRIRKFFADHQLATALAPVRVRVSDLLAKIDGGEANSYWRIDRELGLDELGRQVSLTARDIRKLPGWSGLDTDLQKRVVAAAERYLRAGKCSPEKWLGSEKTWQPALAGYRALILLAQEDPPAFKDLDAHVWREWAPIIAGFPGLEENDARKDGLLARAYRHEPEGVIRAVIALCSKDARNYGFIFAHRRLQLIWDERVGAALMPLLDSPLKAEAFEDLLGLLITRRVVGAVDLARALVPSSTTAVSEQPERTGAAAFCLMRYALADAWTIIYPLLRSDRSFSRALVGRVARDAEMHHECITKSLTEMDCVKFLQWLEVEFPEEQDPDISDAHAVSQREEISELRRSILKDLAARGTVAALDALRAAEQANRNTRYLRWAVLEAEHNTLLGTWHPVSPSDLRALARDASKRLVSDVDGLLTVLSESLRRLNEKLQGQARLVRFVWDKQRDGSFMPVDENVFSDFVREHLEADITKSGIVLNREVQLRPSVASGTGERTDIHVDAIASDPVTGALGRLTVVIETKGAWNPELFTAMDTQLREKYLSGTGVTRGIYLVGWFASALWSDDNRKASVPREGLDSTAKRLRKQADAMSVDGLLISSVVLDASLPGQCEDRSARKKPSRQTKSRQGASAEEKPKKATASRSRKKTRSSRGNSEPKNHKQTRAQSIAKRKGTKKK
jgi:hypothetical protein